MDFSFSVFKEPRGVMRIIHLIFSISAFAAVCEFTGSVTIDCKLDPAESKDTYDYAYPFNLNYSQEVNPIAPNPNPQNVTCHPVVVTILGDFSSDARFFVATGVLAMLFTFIIIFVYIKYENLYKTNSQVPLADFVITVIFAVLWLSSSAAWANGLSGLKHVTDPDSISWANLAGCSKCPTATTGFSTLNIAVVLGFLNFFLWAADLWFVYKETAWFQSNQGITSSGV